MQKSEEGTRADGAGWLERAGTRPDEVDDWLRRLESASSDDERLFYLSRIQALEPQDPAALGWMYEMLRRLLQREPALAYLEEDENLYRVRTARDLILVVAKNRAVPETYRPGRLGRFGRAYHDLMLAVAGLVLSGPAAILFGCLSMIGAVRAARSGAGHARARAAIIVAIALLILLPAVLLTYLLWLHIVS